MENGLYDGAADIWSLGITSIEIADKKPPLFSQNAMAALYQIAQADPPTLVKSEWSPEFHEFVGGLLRKTPSERLTAKQALETKWFKNNRENPSTLIELIRRTKKMVEEQENSQVCISLEKILHFIKKLFSNESKFKITDKKTFSTNG